MKFALSFLVAQVLAFLGEEIFAFPLGGTIQLFCHLWSVNC